MQQENRDNQPRVDGDSGHSNKRRKTPACLTNHLTMMHTAWRSRTSPKRHGPAIVLQKMGASVNTPIMIRYKFHHFFNCFKIKRFR
jgi:hypothetical protein